MGGLNGEVEGRRGQGREYGKTQLELRTMGGGMWKPNAVELPKVYTYTVII